MSTISQNNIVVNYVITSDQIAKTKTEFDKLTDAEKKAVDEAKKLNDQLKKTGNEGQQSGKKTEDAILKVTGPIKQNTAALSAFTSQLKVAGTEAQAAANKASVGFAGVEAKQRSASAAANAFRTALQSIDAKPLTKVKEEAAKVKDETSNSAKELNSFSSIAKSGAGLLAGFFALSSIKAFTERIIETTIKFEGYTKAIEFGSGSAENFARNQEFLTNLINKYGLGLAQTTEAYKSFFNASTLAGQSQQETNRQFEAVTKAGTVLKLTTDQMQGAFLALGQMMSKGTVQAEELRGQLGERIPGAFSIMAKALGVNERQLNKMLEQGQVLSKDALPKFAAELEKTFGPKAEQSLNGMVNSQNRFNNSIDKLILAVGDKLEPFLKGAYDLAAGIATQLAGVGQAAKKETVENIALKKTESDIAKKILDVSIQQGVQIDRRRAASELLFSIDKKIDDQLNQNANSRIAKDELALKKGVQKLAILQQEEILLTQIAGVEIKGGEKKAELTDAELKALKAQYEARLKLLDVEEKIALAKAEIEFEDPLQLERESYIIKKKYTDLKIALDLEAAKSGIKGAEEASKVRKAEIISTAADVIQANNKELKSLKDKNAKIEEENKDLADKRKTDLQNQIQEKKKTDAELARLEREKAIEFEKIKKENAEKDKKFDDEIKDITKQENEALAFALGEFSDMITTRRLDNINREYNAMQRQYNEEVRLADGNVQKITELDEKRKAKEKELREKEFYAQQQNAIAQVIFKTAPIIAEYFATGVLAPAAIAALAVQTAQIGFILSQPVPEFAEGTKGKKYKGRAIVGEQGTEKVVTQSGRVYYTPPVATLAQFDEPVEIIPNHQLGLNDRKQLSLIYGNRSTTSDSGGKIIEKLSNIEIGLKNMPVAAISLDERGFMKKVRTPNRSTTILNNRFKN